MVCIRKAVPADALGVAIVNVYTWKTAYHGLVPEEIVDVRIGQIKERAKQCQEDIKINDNVLVATIDDTIVGFCIYSSSRNDKYQDTAELQALYVLEGFHKEGIGGALFLAAVRELRKLEYSTMFLNCVHGNPSLNFYIHMGGKVVEERKEEIMGVSITMDIVYYDNLNAIVRNPANVG